MPQVVTGRPLQEDIPYGWQVPSCWFWPQGLYGLSTYPERLNVSLKEHQGHPHRIVRLDLQEFANIDWPEVARQWEEKQQ